MPHQFLHHFEFGPDAPEQGRIGVSESMPADALLNIEGFGNWPNVFAKDGCAPVRPSSLVQSARKGPGVTTYKLARLSPGDQRISELRMERDRLLRGLRLAATDDAEDDRSVTLSSPRSKSTSRHLSPNSSPLPRACGCCEENERAFAKSEVVDQSSNLQGGKHSRSAPPLCALSDNLNRFIRKNETWMSYKYWMVTRFIYLVSRA